VIVWRTAVNLMVGDAGVIQPGCGGDAGVIQARCSGDLGRTRSVTMAAAYHAECRLHYDGQGSRNEGVALRRTGSSDMREPFPTTVCSSGCASRFEQGGAGPLVRSLCTPSHGVEQAFSECVSPRTMNKVHSSTALRSVDLNDSWSASAGVLVNDRR
jgi:hypothetical protein